MCAECKNRQYHRVHSGPAILPALSLSKSFFDKLSNANRVAGFAFEKAAPGCAHNLCAFCAQIPHLPGVSCFVRCTRHRTKPIYILFAPAGANSTRFFDSLRAGNSAGPFAWRICKQRTRRPTCVFCLRASHTSVFSLISLRCIRKLAK